MPVSKATIEDLYSRIPILRPPQTIYHLRNAQIGADQLYSATHGFNATVRQAGDGYHIFGMTEIGTDFVTLAADAPESTVVHEAVHGQGLASEFLTYRVTDALMVRARSNLGFVRRPVHYQEVGVSPSERDAFLSQMRLSAAPGESLDGVQLVKLVYTPG